MSYSRALVQTARYPLEHGVFYVMEQDPIFGIGDSIRAVVRRPDTPDVVYHEGVVAPSWNFIADLYRDLAVDGAFGPDSTLASIDGSRIFIVDDMEDLDRKWTRLILQNDAFIKVVLAYSEEYDQRRADPERYQGTATPGLNPVLLPEIVRRAHAASLRVSVHIETAGDFRVAVASGADLIAHLPANWILGTDAGFTEGEHSAYLLSDDDARLAAKQGEILRALSN